MKYFFLVLFIYLIFSTNHTFAQAQNGNTKEIKYERFIEKSGDVLRIALPATALIATIAAKDRQGSKQFVFSFATNLALTFSLKSIIKKRRPEGSNEFNSFPSGHTSVSFQSAAFLQKRYGWKYGIPAYALAAFTWYSRVEGLNDRHDVWDVLAGAAVGIGSAYLFTKPHQKENLKIAFSAGNGGYLLKIKYKF